MFVSKRVLAVLLLVASRAMAQAQPDDVQPQAEGIESPNYVWNAKKGEQYLALSAKGSALRGAVTFEVCQGCHRVGALGRPDGSYPRLAGQHASVLIKQMTDIRAGRRENPKMYPFVSQHVIGPTDIADIAVYLQNLPVPPDNGKGAGGDLDKARSLYARDCQACHGANGAGDAPKFFPRVSGQHYKYLLREARYIRDGKRRNANPDMVEVIRPYSDADLDAVADYMSRFPLAGN